MKWFTHQTVAGLAAAASGLGAAALGGALAGAVLPDVIDQRLAALSRNPQRRFNQIHRGSSHWFGWYAALLLFAAAPLAAPSLPLWPVLRPLAFGLALGALSHIMLDMLTPAGVPLRPFSRQGKVSLRLCSTGSAGEYLLLAACLGFGLMFFRSESLALLARLGIYSV